MEATMKLTVHEIAETLNCQLIGNGSAPIAAVASLQSAGDESLVFVDDARHLDSALASRAAAVIAGKFAASARSDKPLLIHPQPRLAFARAAKFLRENECRESTHESAIVAPSARIGKNVPIGARAVLGDNVTIGDGTTIGAGCVIGDDVKIGAGCRIDANVTIYSGTTLGDRVVVQAGAVLGSEGFGYVRDSETGRYEQFPQVGRLVIEDDVEIGANSTIDRGALDETRIRRGTKIDNLVHVGHNCQIGQDVVIAPRRDFPPAPAQRKTMYYWRAKEGDHVLNQGGRNLGAQSDPIEGPVSRQGDYFRGTPAR
jgi:UDP-3-O-[3-hydroxymyristoyl] glucosamine N-acyltransferase